MADSVGYTAWRTIARNRRRSWFYWTQVDSVAGRSRFGDAAGNNVRFYGFSRGRAPIPWPVIAGLYGVERPLLSYQGTPFFRRL